MRSSNDGRDAVQTAPADDDPAAFEVQIDGQSERLNSSARATSSAPIAWATTGKSVVDADQRSWDHKNLYLVGSGTFPTVATANPTLTLTALALRTADALLKDLA